MGIIAMNIRVADIHLTTLILNKSCGIFRAFLIIFLNIANNNHFVQCFCGEKGGGALKKRRRQAWG